FPVARVRAAPGLWTLDQDPSFRQLNNRRVPSGKTVFHSCSEYGVPRNAPDGLICGGFDCQMKVSIPDSMVTPFLVTSLRRPAVTLTSCASASTRGVSARP